MPRTSHLTYRDLFSKDKKGTQISSYGLAGLSDFQNQSVWFTCGKFVNSWKITNILADALSHTYNNRGCLGRIDLGQKTCRNSNSNTMMDYQRLKSLENLGNTLLR